MQYIKSTFVLFSLALSTKVSAQDMPLSQILLPGEKWELAVDGIGFADAPTADDKGNFYFSDMRSQQGLFRLSPDGKKHPFLKGATGISGMKFGLMANSMRAEPALRSWLKLIHAPVK